MTKLNDFGLGFYYRYVDVLKSGDYWDSVEIFRHAPMLEIKLEEIPIMRKTPKGVILYDAYNYQNDQKRLVLDWWSRKWAWPTIIAARTDFLKRKKNQHLIHEERSARARQAYLQACEEFQMEPEGIKKTASLRTVYDLIPRSMVEE